MSYVSGSPDPNRLNKTNSPGVTTTARVFERSKRYTKECCTGISNLKKTGIRQGIKVQMSQKAMSFITNFDTQVTSGLQIKPALLKDAFKPSLSDFLQTCKKKLDTKNLQQWPKWLDSFQSQVDKQFKAKDTSLFFIRVYGAICDAIKDAKLINTAYSMLEGASNVAENPEQELAATLRAAEQLLKQFPKTGVSDDFPSTDSKGTSRGSSPSNTISDLTDTKGRDNPRLYEEDPIDLDAELVVEETLALEAELDALEETLALEAGLDALEEEGAFDGPSVLGGGGPLSKNEKPLARSNLDAIVPKKTTPAKGSGQLTLPVLFQEIPQLIERLVDPILQKTQRTAFETVQTRINTLRQQIIGIKGQGPNNSARIRLYKQGIVNNNKLLLQHHKILTVLVQTQGLKGK